MARDPKQDDVTLEEATTGNLRFKKRSKKDFTQIENVVTFCRGLSDGAYRTYVMICSKDWGDHPQMPTLAELAEWQGKSTRAIFTHICELRQANLIVYVRQGLGKPNDIDVTAEEQWTLSVLDAERKKTSDGPRRKKTSEPAGKIVPIKSEENFRTTRKKTADPSIDNTFSHTNTHTSEHTGGANAPRAATPRRPALKQSDPELWKAREAIREAYTAISGQARNKWTNGDCEALARDYGAEDSIATLRAMWTITRWDGAYKYRTPLKLSVAHGLVPAWRRGELRSDPPKGTGPAGGIPRTGTSTDAQIRAAHDGIQICGPCQRELGWGDCDACTARARKEGRE